MTQLRDIFYRRAAEAERRVQAAGGRFAYYTSAETAFRILQSEHVWMRSTRTMNDFMEVEHGVDCAYNALHSPQGDEFRAAVDSLFPNLSDEAEELFKDWIPRLQSDTFVTCVSEHDVRDDEFGRLSMWRAYGGRSGVAIIINGGVMFRHSDALGAYSSPVAYLDAKGVAQELRLVADAIRSSPEILASAGREAVRGHIFGLLRFASICTKHPGFEEEREWRIVASPALHASEKLPPLVEVVGGVPQTVLKIPLRDDPKGGLTGLHPSALIDRIIIGPTEYPDVIARALRSMLKTLGVPRFHDRVFVSDIPLREAQK